jgi:magnesium transporter
MSEFSMMTAGVPWPLAYGGFLGAVVFMGFATYHALRYFEQRKTQQLLAARRRKDN